MVTYSEAVALCLDFSLMAHQLDGVVGRFLVVMNVLHNGSSLRACCIEVIHTLSNLHLTTFPWSQQNLFGMMLQGGTKSLLGLEIHAQHHPLAPYLEASAHPLGRWWRDAIIGGRYFCFCCRYLPGLVQSQ